MSPNRVIRNEAKIHCRAQVNEQEMAVENDKHYRLDQSLFERMMLPAFPEITPFPTSRLNIQRRAHPVIADIMRATLYPQLKDEKSTHHHPAVAGMTERLWWFDHRHPEARPGPHSEFATSFINNFEVEMTYGLVQYLVNTNEYNFGDIAVLTPYNGQLEALNQRLRGTCSIWLIEKDKEILRDLEPLDMDDLEKTVNEDANGKTTFDMSNMLRLATIDNFQGEEAKIVILSTVRSNFDNRVGFLKTSNRINVACSRAKHGFYIIGNASLMQTIGMWRSIVELLTQKGKIGASFHACCSRHPKSQYEIRRPEEFAQVPICGLICSGILPCGHICKDKCHPRTLHQRMSCTYPCHRRHEICGHACQKLCGEPCGDCTQPSTPKVLSCGHTHLMTCKDVQKDTTPECEATLEIIKLDCGHDFTRTCGAQDEQLVCQQPCSAILPCGHRCSDSCSHCRGRGNHSLCDGQCGRIGDCSHSCPRPCHESPCPPCEVVCERPCAHGTLKHKCSIILDPCTKPCAQISGCHALCCLPCTRTASNNPCRKILKCGHVCPGLEDEQCHKTCTQCITGTFPDYLQVYLPCTHAVDVQTLDQHLDVPTLFEVTDLGIIDRPKPSAMKMVQQPSCCPRCGQPIDEIRRYSGAKKLREVSSTLDELYVMLGQKLKSFMMRTFNTQNDLEQERKTFAQKLISGPLGGKNNENLVKLRGTKTVDLQADIVNFRGK